MRVPVTTLRVAALTLTLGLCVVAACPAAAQDSPPKVPNWELPGADGVRIDFHAALAEGPVVVSFWALWCKPCLKELPHLEKLAREFAGRLTVLAVNIDSQRSVAKVRPFLKSKGYEGVKVPLDTAGDVSRKMQVGDQVPFLAVYRPTGEVVYQHVGYKEGDEKILLQKIEALLAEAETPMPRDAAEDVE